MGRSQRERMRLSYLSRLSMAFSCSAGLVACTGDPPVTTEQTTTDASSSSTDPLTSGSSSSSTSSSSTTESPTSTDPSSSSGPPPPACGDGNVDPGEECDDANADDTDACTNACTNATCGDGIVGPGEACDDGNADNTDACTDQCASASCGDGAIQPPEECDDANADDTDACLATCKSASCGDMVVQAGVEECDDANADDTDDCVAGCKTATCGDAFVQAGIEECDDANTDDTDDCVAGCKTATCGDGFVQMMVEACDDGNMSNLDACTTMCKASACDDMIQSGAESDVDCGGMSCPKCGVDKACVKASDCGSAYCAMNKCTLAASCQQIKMGEPMSPSGIYSIDPDGMGMGPAIKVYCDMTTDGGGWTMVYKISAGVAGDANTLWNGPALNENDDTLLNLTKSTKHYVSSYIGSYWNKAGVVITDVRTHVYKAGTIQKFWKYDGKLSTAINWYTNTKLTGSSYMDLPAGPFNFFSILGDAPNGRRFFINRAAGGCAVESGWLVLDSMADPCTWETNNAMSPAIRILYSAGQTFTSWQSAQVNNQLGIGEVFAVFAR